MHYDFLMLSELDSKTLQRKQLPKNGLNAEKYFIS